MICDSHAHLNHGDVFDDDREAVIDRASRGGVTRILNVATSPADAAATVDLAIRHDFVFAAVGIHPHEAGTATEVALLDIEELAKNPRVVAWGEIGLDYHYLHSPREVQIAALARQLEIAGRLDLPVSLHTREADADTVSLIGAHAGPARGVIHCFTGDQELADACLGLDFHISFSGIVTFRNADALRAVARRVPDHRLLVETDSPFLAPAPRRGGRNEPLRVLDVLQVLAEVRDVPVEGLARQILDNFDRLFLAGGARLCGR